MITVRPYDKKDYYYIRKICLNNFCSKGKSNPTNSALLCAEHCDYYLDCESEFVFVAVNDDNVPLAYIMCAVDLDNYFQQTEEQYLPLVRKLSGTDYFRLSAELKLEQKYIKQGYPVHLHFSAAEFGDDEPIDTVGEPDDAANETESSENDESESGVDIAEIKSMLFNTLISKLKEDFVEGVYVVCGERNKDERRFYENLGFTDIDYLKGSVVYGKKLFDDDQE